MAKMISITEDGMFMASEQITPVDFLNLTLHSTMQMFQNVLKNVPEEQHQSIKNEMYDMFNEGASAFLKAFDPDRELRPDLTAEAILKAENELIATKAEEEGHTLQGDIKRSAAKIKAEMEKDGLITPVKLTEDGNVIPLNRKERRHTSKK